MIFDFVGSVILEFDKIMDEIVMINPWDAIMAMYGSMIEDERKIEEIRSKLDALNMIEDND